MKKIILILTFAPFLTIGQNIYSGLHGQYKYKWTFKINPDSSVFLTKNIDSYGYEEYSGKISRNNDTLFNIKLRLDFAQCACRAVGDSKLYVSLDSSLSKTIEQLTVVYSNSETSKTSVSKQKKIIIPLNKKLSSTDPMSDFFYVTTGHKNPIDNSEVKTLYKVKDEFCVELFQRNGGLIKVVIKGDKLRKIGKGVVDNFTLLKQ